jgi:N-acetylglucosamine-6-phosphate deacetylase
MSATPADLSRMQRFLAAHGVAHYLPTTVTADIDTTLRALEALADAIELAKRIYTNLGAPGPASETWVSGQAQPMGIHLEGPFLSHAKRGVHPAALLQPPSAELFDRFWQASRGHIALMTIAPELCGPSSNPTGPSSALGGPSFAPFAKGGVSAAANPSAATDSAVALVRHATALGVRCSLGHSNALAAETLAAINAGATSATHTFNAMRALDHREPGILGMVLDDDRLCAELICDGIHVAPELVRLWLKTKGEHRAILVTDAMSATGMPDGEYKLGELAVTVEDNRALLSVDLKAGKRTLAGSLLTMDKAVANLQHFAAAPLATATRLAAHNPAAMLGRPELTTIQQGSTANLNRFNETGHLTATYLHGQEVAQH